MADVAIQRRQVQIMLAAEGCVQAGLGNAEVGNEVGDRSGFVTCRQNNSMARRRATSDRTP